MNETLRKMIETKFVAVMASDGIAIEFPNVKFDRENKLEWIRLNILDGQAITASLGRTKKIKQPGIVQATVFIKRNSGTKRLREIVDIISAGFRNLRLEESGVEIDFRVPSLDNGDAGDPVLYWENVSLPFVAESTQTDAT